MITKSDTISSAVSRIDACDAAPTGHRVVKRWIDESGAPRSQTFPVAFNKASNAAAVITALLDGGFLSGGGFQDFYGPADIARGAVLTMEHPAWEGPTPAMVPLPVQQQQAQAGQSTPAAEVPPASQPEPETAEIEPSVSYKLGPIDRRCRHWERVLREGVVLPMPEDVHGAGDLPGSYAPDRGEEELFGMDAVMQGEENHHRRSRGWSYWLHVRDPKTGDIETIQPSAARKTVIKDAIRLGRIDLPREILKGAGDIAALVRILSAIRAGLPIQEIVDAE